MSFGSARQPGCVRHNPGRSVTVREVPEHPTTPLVAHPLPGCGILDEQGERVADRRRIRPHSMHDMFFGVAPREWRARCDKSRDTIEGGLLCRGPAAGDHRFLATHSLNVRQAETLVPRWGSVDRCPAKQIPDEGASIAARDIHNSRSQSEVRGEFHLLRHMKPRAWGVTDLGDVDHIRMIGVGQSAENLLESL